MLKGFFYTTLTALFLFSCGGKEGVKDNEQSSQAEKPNLSNMEGFPTASIVFVNIDSLLNGYILYKESREKLESRAAKSQEDIGKKIEAFQRKVASFESEVMRAQQNAENIAPIELQKLQEKFGRQQQGLAQEEQKLMKEREEAAIGLEADLNELQAELKEKIDGFLERLAKEKSYDFILSKGSVGGVLYGDAALDITSEVITEINIEHLRNKK
jgi:Skp family chaperone for outer membrane proteins